MLSYNQHIKRFLDFLLAGTGLLVLSPVLLITAILVRLKLGSPVIFCQERPGRNEKIFKLYKFRSMTDKRDKNGALLPDEVRLTKFGKLLRTTSLDELPELINILVGDMSIVGPRPQLVRDMTFMSQEQRRRHTVRPGLTGLAQVSGRNNITWEKKFEYDLEYINKGITLFGDLAILFKTAFKVLKREDTVREGTVSDIDFGDWLLENGSLTASEYAEGQQKAKELMKV